MNAEETIKKLDDARARQILNAVVRPRLATGPVSETILELTPVLRNELASAFGLSDAPPQPASEAELARQALLVLAEDPATRVAIESIASQPVAAPQKFDFGTSLALTAAALIVLQTHVRFERYADGKWTIKLEKKPTSDVLLRGLVQKLLGFTE